MKVLSLEHNQYGALLKACVKLPYGDCIISITTEGCGVSVYDKEDNKLFCDEETTTIDSAVQFIETRDWSGEVSIMLE